MKSRISTAIAAGATARSIASMDAERAMQPTLKDVARAARVSPATVSYVLNNNRSAERISAETKQRILSAAGRLGYKLNPIGRALQRGYTNQVTLIIVNWNLAISHAATALAISRQAARHDLALTVQVMDDDHSAERFIRQNSLHKLGGVLVLWDSPAFKESALLRLAADHVPVVDLLPGSPEGVSMVTADREDASYRATRHLLGLGHKHIGLISDSVTRPKTTSQKVAGYRRALREAGVAYQPQYVQEVTEFGFEGGRAGFRMLFSRCPEITALFCINDAIALGAMDAARGAGLNCPADLSIVGFGDSPEGSHWRPTLTTVALSADLVAESAVGLIRQQRSRRETVARSILIPEGLIVRESTRRAGL
jgi:DNA-binding LacI/PurR family transcriptional regulator